MSNPQTTENHEKAMEAERVRQQPGMTAPTTCPNCHGEGAIVTVGGSRNTCEECFGVGHTGSPFAPRETDIPEFGGTTNSLGVPHYSRRECIYECTKWLQAANTDEMKTFVACILFYLEKTDA